MKIKSKEGRATEDSWTNTNNSASTVKSTFKSDFGLGAYMDGKLGISKNNPLQSVEVGVHIKLKAVFGKKTVSQSTLKASTSGLTSDEWSTAQQTSGNSLQAAFLTLNLAMVNTGTLPADNLQVVCNLRLNQSIISTILVGNSEFGELQARSGNVNRLIATTDGFVTGSYPSGAPLTLTMSQLRSIQCGAPLSLDVQSFEGDTLVWELDPDTGRRTYLTYGEWSPYESAIRNTSARVMVDFSDDPTYAPQLFNGLPIMRVDELRVACFPTDGSYSGSPPQVDLYDALHWGFEVRASSFGPVVTIRDPISNWKHTSLISDWNFKFDQETVEDIIANPQDYSNLFMMPLLPGNPVDKFYICQSPPQGELRQPQIYWALCNPESRKIQSYSRDVEGIKEMRFKPDPEADYDGEEMGIGYDPDDPDMEFFYTYELPAQYKWTGFEQVVAINNNDKRTEMNIEILGSQLGQMIDGGTFGVTGGGVQGFSFDSIESGTITDPPYDFTFEQTWVGEDLTLTLTPMNGGMLHDAMVVIDPPDDPPGNPQFLLDYNYLRKQAYGSATLDETILAGATSEAPISRTYCVLSQTGILAVFSPVLFCQDNTAPYQYEVGEIVWRTYEGI